MIGDDELTDRAARIVADERDVFQIERVHEVADELRLAVHREIGVVVHRRLVTTERQRRRDAAKAIAQELDHVAPDLIVDEQTVHEEQHRALTNIDIFDLALRNLHGPYYAIDA